jgi:hypothetical protein
MKRLGRWMLNAVTVLSLLLCVATVGLWVRSQSGADIWAGCAEAAPPGRAALVGSERGYLSIMIDGGWPFRGQWTVAPHLSFLTVAGSTNITAVGWGYERGTAFGRLGPPGTKAPFAPRPIPFVDIHWLWPTVLTSVLPLLGARRRMRRAIVDRRQRLRRAAGLCLVCSFDLTGNVSGVCPECGTAIVAKGNT